MAYEPNYVVHVPWLEGSGRNDYSQFGEDGLIEACLQRIGEESKRCFEFGAADGLFFSNTKRLRDQGWQALLFESSDRWTSPDVVRLEITPENINEHISGEFDLGVIDVDGRDYELFEALECRPRVMCVEFNPYMEGDYIPPPGPVTDCMGATLHPIVWLGERKGYQHVATTYCNVLFVHRGH